MSTTIIMFWKENPSFWITPPSKHAEVDAIIRDKFWGYDWVSDTLIGQVIYLDQFSRHFARLGLMTESDVLRKRYFATYMIRRSKDFLYTFDEVEIIFALMPFKHIKDYGFIFEAIHTHWLSCRMPSSLLEYPDLQRFYIDTYKKAFTIHEVSANLITEHKMIELYYPDLICEYHPPVSDWNLDAAHNHPLLKHLAFDSGVIVSLSGGVDSMVMLSLLKYLSVDVKAVHIIYGNRMESEYEYRFLANFCERLDVPLIVYRVKWLRRGEVDRAFYEEMTRSLRFFVYQAVCERFGAEKVLLGHIQDDVVENVWSNIAHCHHLGNLKKMEREEVQQGVRIVRPFLDVKKSDIYALSEAIGVPYLKNTTPSWSNRGKFREHFHAATVEQFGEGIDNKIIEFADAIQSQGLLIDKLLYEPIYKSFQDNTVNITNAVDVNLDITGWLKIFETICHKHLDCSKPSIKCVRDFCMRLLRPWETLNCEMGKGVKVKLYRMGNQSYMRFICA